MTKIDFETSYLYAGAIVRPGELFLLMRRDYESDDAHCVALITDGNKRQEFRIDNDFYVGVVVHDNQAYLLGQNGNTIRFDVAENATTEAIEQSRADFRIEAVDEFLELTKIRIIGEKVYCCGQFGQLYSRDSSSWVRADDGGRSMDSPDFEDIGGMSSHELYGIGLEGEMSWYDGKSWKAVMLSTNQNINVIGAGEEKLFAAGYNGLVLRGHKDIWEVVGEPITDRHYWDLAVHNGVCYLLHETGIDFVDDDIVKEVALKEKFTSTARKFATGAGQLWIVCQDSVYLFGEKMISRMVIS